MPISDPGNAEAANQPKQESYVANGQPQRAFPTSAQEDRRRRITSLTSGITTALALITGAVLVPLLDSWTPAGLAAAGWLAVLTLSTGIMNYRYGPLRGKR